MGPHYHKRIRQGVNPRHKTYQYETVAKSSILNNECCKYVMKEIYGNHSNPIFKKKMGEGVIPKMSIKDEKIIHWQ